MLLVIRHGRAGDSSEWEGDDRLRPLDKRGRRQAGALVESLAPFAIARILSSPYDRCVQTVEPLRYRGNEVILFHMLDPQEIKPKFRDPVLLVDMEQTHNAMEVSPEYARNEYKRKIDSHIEALSSKARGAGMDYFLMDTSRPLDEGLREYLSVRRGRF